MAKRRDVTRDSANVGRNDGIEETNQRPAAFAVEQMKFGDKHSHPRREAGKLNTQSDSAVVRPAICAAGFTPLSLVSLLLSNSCPPG